MDEQIKSDLAGEDLLIFETAMLAGSLLLKYGAETYQIESTLEGLLALSPHSRASVDSLLTGLWISYRPEGQPQVSAMTRVRGHAFNLYILIGVHRICQALIKGTMTFPEGYAKLKELEARPPAGLTPAWAILATVVSGITYTVMMGGNLLEALFSGIASIGLSLVQVLLARLPLSAFMPTFLSAMVASLILSFLSLARPDLNLTLMMAGTLLILFPGTTLTNGIRDTMRGNFLTAAGNFVSAAMTAVALAFGAGISLAMAGLYLSQPSMGPITGMAAIIIASLGGGLGTVAISYYLGGRGKLVGMNFVIGFAGWFLYLVLGQLDMMVFIQVLLASALVGLLSWIGSRLWDFPVTVFTLPSLYTLVPGTQLYLAVNALLQGHYSQSLIKTGEAFLVASAIAIGLLLIETAFALQEDYAQKKKLKADQEKGA